jgi:hypothetical protein
MSNGGIITRDFRNVIRTYLGFAEQYRKKTEAAIDELRPFLNQRYLLSLEIIFNLYLEIFKRIDVENSLFKTSEFTPSPEETKQIVVDILEKKDY